MQWKLLSCDIPVLGLGLDGGTGVVPDLDLPVCCNSCPVHLEVEASASPPLQGELGLANLLLDSVHHLDVIIFEIFCHSFVSLHALPLFGTSVCTLSLSKPLFTGSDGESYYYTILPFPNHTLD
jgi:hypothetical protein